MKKAAAAAVVVSLVVSAPRLVAQSASVIIERVIVRVNGEIFTQTQLAQRQTDAIRDRNRGAQNIPDAAVMKMLAEVTPAVLVDAVDELLIAQHGRELGAKFTDVEFKTAIETIKKENNLSDAQLKQAMEQEGLTMDQLRTNFERAYMIQAVQSQEVFRRMNITEEELRQYYNGHKDALVTPEMVTLREITVSAPTQSVAGAFFVQPDAAAAARTKIESIRARAAAGEDFAGLAKTLSDSATKDTGGLIGPVDVADINAGLKALVDKLSPGEITDPLELPRGGFQIFKLESRQPSAELPFDKARDRVEQAVRTSRLGGEMQKIKARLRTQAVIEWKDEILKQQYQRRLSELASQ